MCDAALSPRILISGADGKMSNYVRAVRAAAARLFLVTAPQRTCPAPGCCCAAAATWTPSVRAARPGLPAPRDPARDQAELELFRAFYQAAALSWGSAGGCRSSTWPWGHPASGPGGHPASLPYPPQADQVHPVRAQPGSLLHTLYGPRFSVNSSHHQAVDCPAPGLSSPSGRWTAFPRPWSTPPSPFWGSSSTRSG